MGRLSGLIGATVIACFLAGEAAAMRPVASLPFELSGSYVVVNASINGSQPLSFIFDTGVRSTIITHLDGNEQLSLLPGREVPVRGLGAGLELTGIVSENNQLQLGKLQLKNRMVIVLDEDILQLSELNGRKINGLLGVDILQGHVVEVNYTRRRILFYDTANYHAPKRYHSRQLIVEDNKLYLPMTLFDSSFKIRRIKMFIDTGALLNAWFLTVNKSADDVSGSKIQARIGAGFGGEVYGYLARIPKMCLDEFCFEGPIVAFPDSAVVAEVIRRSDRDGTIGSELLSRFNLVFDLHRQTLHFRPNGFFKAPFVYNVSGIELMQAQPPLPEFVVTEIWRNSPAERAGVSVGDRLIAIDNNTVLSYKLGEIRTMFQKTSRRPLRLLLMRNGQRVEVELDMLDRLK
jgi:hypothetical protein